MATAFGIAVSGAGGVRRNFGTMAKALQTGNAARNGVNAALLAQKGFTADRTILEAPMGFASALCLEGECDWEMLTKGLGRVFLHGATAGDQALSNLHAGASPD